MMYWSCSWVVPSGAEAHHLCEPDGPAEAVPFPKTMIIMLGGPEG